MDTIKADIIRINRQTAALRKIKQELIAELKAIDEQANKNKGNK